MDLVQGRSARQRNDFVLRLGCWMVTLSMVFSLVIQPPKAKAIVAEASLATSVIWAFMQSAGITFNGTGMNSSSWAEGIEPYLREFTEATDSAAKSFWHWLGYDGAADFIKALSWSKITHPSTMPFPSVTIPPAVAKKLARFTVWFAKKVGLASGGGSVYVAGDNFTSAALSTAARLRAAKLAEDPDNGFWASVDKNSHYFCYKYVGNTWSKGYYILYCVAPITIERHDRGFSAGGQYYEPGYYLYKNGSTNGFQELQFDTLSATTYSGGATIGGLYYRFCSLDTIGDYVLSAADASICSATQPGALSPTYDDTEQKATIITIPGLDTEIAGINELLQAILDKLAANELTTSATIAQQPTPEQPDEEKPDIDGLGLPALGTALMTRFPFSIPWDVVRGIKLLAAPAEAPYWEVDFLAPIAGRVGGWKGSTKVVIDMGQYEIIGQLCRWTSTIGFCLVLAAGTKKLIWTA